MLNVRSWVVEGNEPCIEISDPQAVVEKPLVSVLMITYKHANYVAEAIEGVLSQVAEFPFELVIGEDCSPDDTMNVIRSYAEKRPDIVRIITAEVNVGLKRNSWRTHWLCRGKYIAYCDGDDYWHDRRKLQKQVHLLENNAKCVLVHSDIDILYQEKQTRIDHLHRRLKHQFVSNLPTVVRFNRILSNQEMIYSPTVCVRRALLHEILKSDPKVFRSSDFPMADTPRWLELARRGQFRYLDESTATLRRLSESASRSNNLERLVRFTVGAMRMRLYYCAKFGCDNVALNLELRRRGLQALRRACLANDQDLITSVREACDESGCTPTFLFWLAKYQWCRRTYGLFDRRLIQIRRTFRRFKYRVESSI